MMGFLYFFIQVLFFLCQDAPAVSSECTNSFRNLVNVEESTCSYKTRSSIRVTSENGKEDRSLSIKDVFPDYFVAESSKCDFDVSNNLSHTVHLDFPACTDKSKVRVSLLQVHLDFMLL